MIKKCENGHWYDTSVHRACPHCKQNSEKLSIRLQDVEEDDRTISFMDAGAGLDEELGAIIGSTVSNVIPSNTGSGATAGDRPEEDRDATIAFGFFGELTVRPVTGWLVCMTGEERGKDYRLCAGKNFIGRSTSMDVVLLDDKSISRERHCSVSYDPKGNTFYLSSEGGNLTYLNGELLEKPEKLNAGDCIGIGKTELIFIPFCTGERKWERTEKSEK